MSTNHNLNKARKKDQDEFYTQYADIETELQNYTEYLSNKIVYCNCDDYNKSNFCRYFVNNFDRLNLERLYCTGYNHEGNGSYFEYDGKQRICRKLEGDGSYDSDECRAILGKSDIVITNPPFSKFISYIDTIFESGKSFLIVGNFNAIKYKNIFPQFMRNKIRLGVSNHLCLFEVPQEYEYDKVIDDRYYKAMSNSCWYTNLPVELTRNWKPTRHFVEEDYEKYDDYDAINIDHIVDIPCDYDGVMGVPIYFLRKYYNPRDFKILGMLNFATRCEFDYGRPTVKGINRYTRILIQKR